MPIHKPIPLVRQLILQRFQDYHRLIAYLKILGSIYISAEELQSEGMPTDFLIESIHLLIFDLPGVTLNNFTISMKNTGTNSFNATPTYDDDLTNSLHSFKYSAWRFYYR